MPPESEVIAEVRARVEKRLEGLEPWIKAQSKRAKPEQQLLLWGLFEVWVYSFGGKLTVTDRDEPPRGDLVKFIRAATPDFSPPISLSMIRNCLSKRRVARRRSFRIKK
jgi:hypothetical protein